MILNNLTLDLKTKLLEAGMTQARLAEKMGTTPQYLNRIINGNDDVLSKPVLNVLEELGYDVEVTYVKRQEGATGDA